jgi:hypothetical protein
MAITAYDDSAALPAFVPAGSTKENARIIGVALFKAGFDVSSLDDDPAAWAAGIAAKDIVIINPVTGSAPEPTENQIPGIGRTDTEFNNHSYDWPFRHKGVSENLAFYNNLLKRTDYGAGFMFADNKMLVPLNEDLTPVLINFNARIMSDEDLEGDRFVMCNARWKSDDLPYEFAAPASLFPR